MGHYVFKICNYCLPTEKSLLNILRKILYKAIYLLNQGFRFFLISFLAKNSLPL